MARKYRRVVWAPRAKRDLRDVWSYYERVASAEIADKLLREIGAAGERLADDALTWRRRDEILPGLRSVTVHPYIVFYRVKNGIVEIARVIHERRNFAAVFTKRTR
jgi:toxin ParE1/3/4